MYKFVQFMEMEMENKNKSNWKHQLNFRYNNNQAKINVCTQRKAMKR